MSKFCVITRVRFDDLYIRMKESAMRNSTNEIDFLSEKDIEELPHLANTYNRLGSQSNADYLIFCHDDVVFFDKYWDEKLECEFLETGADILGAVGTEKYVGGTVFSAGRPFYWGKYAYSDPTGEGIKLLNFKSQNKKVSVVDGFFMVVRNTYFKKEKFDEKFNELWFYAEDYCLRSDKINLSELLMGHYKPKDKYGIYPEGMKPIETYEKAFYDKWKMSKPEKQPLENMRVICVSFMDYILYGQDNLYAAGMEKYTHA